MCQANIEPSTEHIRGQIAVKTAGAYNEGKHQVYKYDVLSYKKSNCDATF